MISKKRKHQTIMQILTLGNNFYQSQNYLKEGIEEYLINNYNDYTAIGVLQHIINLDNPAAGEFDWEVIQALTTYIVVDLMRIGSEIDQFNREVIQGIYSDLELVKFIDAKPEYWDEMDKSILTIACEIGSIKLISYTYAQVFRPNLKEETVTRAAANGYSYIIEFFIQNDLRVLQSFGWEVFTHALCMTCAGGHMNVAKLLVDNKLYTFKGPKYNYYSALVPAAENGHLELCKYLVKEIFNDIFDFDLAVNFAAGNGHLDIVIYLEEEGANIHIFNETMIYACEGGQLQVIEYLLSRGVQINPSNLVHTLRNNHYEAAQYIMNMGIDLVSAVICAAEEKRLKCIRYLIRQIIKRNPERLYEVKDHLTDYQKTKYAHLLTTGEFNL